MSARRDYPWIARVARLEGACVDCEHPEHIRAREASRALDELDRLRAANPKEQTG